MTNLLHLALRLVKECSSKVTIITPVVITDIGAVDIPYSQSSY